MSIRKHDLIRFISEHTDVCYYTSKQTVMDDCFILRRTMYVQFGKTIRKRMDAQVVSYVNKQL